MLALDTVFWSSASWNLLMRLASTFTIEGCISPDLVRAHFVSSGPTSSSTYQGRIPRLQHGKSGRNARNPRRDFALNVCPMFVLPPVCGIMIQEICHMEQTVTAKLQISVSPAEKQLLCETMRAYSAACSHVSRYIWNTRVLDRRRVHDGCYRQVREIYGLRSQMALSCERTVIARYKAILEDRKEWIRPVFRLPQLDLVWNRDYSLDRSRDLFSVNTLAGRIRVPFHREGFERYFSDGCRFGTAKLVFRHGRFFLHVPVTYEVSELQKPEVTNVVGVDRGIRFLAVSYDSAGKTVFYDGRAVKQKRAKYKALRRQLQQIGTPSSRRRLRAIGQREHRWIQDVDHCISKALVDSNPGGTMFVLEDLTGIRSAVEKVRVRDRYVTVSWPYYDLEQKLQYKALRNRQLVEKADAAYTSQACPKCGHTERSNRDKRRHLFCCRNCGYRSNDDRIGAMNLHRKGIELLST